jgi:tartrate dehydrogenase/decarboxylase/D-malate dehydrogenase
MNAHRVAVLAGDGVGQEVVPEARRVVDAAGVDVDWVELPWGSEHFHETGRMMPEGAADQLRAFDAILLGAVGHPSVPDHESLWGLLLPIRQQLDLWANVRPVRLLEGVPGALAGRGPEDVDMLFVRENTEGEYAGVGGRAHHGLAHEVAVEVSVFTRTAVHRLMRFSFELARSRRRRLTSATKSNASRFGYVLWDEIAAEVALDFPDVEYDRMLVDALAARMVRDPASLDVVVASNLFGDILTDLGAAIQGGMGMAASANVAPGGDVPGLFEPVHGSAPDIAGRGLANPVGSIWSAAEMLHDLGEADAAARVIDAVAHVMRTGPRTRDIGGSGSTREVADAIVAALDRDGAPLAGAPALLPNWSTRSGSST